MTEDEILILTTIDTALDLKSIARIMAITKAKHPSTEEASMQIALALATAQCRLATDVPSECCNRGSTALFPVTQR
ncbi:MAG: hypothetical protein EOO77_13035 [Oxalobacteraceae bacterium]|nr:MAG: hypothetical protein EOO77_13035 [Oxalobacteraceae bacterium]